MYAKVFCLLLATILVSAHAQRVYLRPAEGGTSNVYTLINSVWGGGATSENPDCSHPSFGRHIYQGNDGTLNKQWEGKIAVVTGGSAGIGSQFVKDLVKNDIHVIGLARRHERIEEIARESDSTPGKIYAHKCDVSGLQSIKDAFKWIEETFGHIHILVNNSGCARNIKILSDNDVTQEIEEIIRTNFNGLVHVTREAYRLIKKSNDYGFICNVNSNLGRKVPFPFDKNMSHNVYHGSKYAVTATSEVIRQELICQDNDKIRVTSLSPGLVQTEIFEAAGYKKKNEESIFANLPSIQAKDVSDAFMYLLSTPYYVNVTELTIKHQSQKT